MRISSIYIQNFKKLYRCKIDFSMDTTLFVGANNSGKTSAMDALGKFLAGRSFVFNDFTISNRELINQIGAQWEAPDCEKPESISFCAKNSSIYMTKEKLNSLFEDKEKSDFNQLGMNLNLNIAKKLIVAHNWDIIANSREDNSSSFGFVVKK